MIAGLPMFLRTNLLHTLLANKYIVLLFTGITSLTDIPPREPFLNMLKALAFAKQRGLTNQEAAQRLNVSSNTSYPSMQKLVSVQLVVKSLITPMKGVRDPRNLKRIYVYHLKRFFPFFQPEEEGMELCMDETSSLRLEATIVAILKRHKLTKMPVHKVRLKMHNTFPRLRKFKRELNVMAGFLKEKSQLVFFDDSLHTRVRTLDDTAWCRPAIGLASVHGSRPPATFLSPHSRVPSPPPVPAPVPSSAPSSAPAPALAPEGPEAPLHGPARNLALYEQLFDRLTVAPCGLRSHQ